MRVLVCVVVLAVIATASAASVEKVPWTEISATWSFSGVLGRVFNTAFFKLPTTAAAAQKEGWVEARAEDYVSLWCLKDDPRVCILYDLKGSIAGIQIGFLLEDTKVAPYDWTRHSLLFKDTVLGHEVVAGRYYLVEQEVLKSGGRDSFDEIGTGVWLKDGDSFTNVPQDATKLEALGWTQENCIPTMGRHYYYNVSTTMDCQDMQPYFVITDTHKLWTHGIGFQSFGKKTKKDRDWLEDVPALAVKPTLPNAPQCLVDWARDYGVLSLHVYFRTTPYLILC